MRDGNLATNNLAMTVGCGLKRGQLVVRLGAKVLFFFSYKIKMELLAVRGKSWVGKEELAVMLCWSFPWPTNKG